MALIQTSFLLGLSAGGALIGVALALGTALFLAVLAATLSTRPRLMCPPPDPPSSITTMAGSIEEVRRRLPPGDYRAWSEHGRPATEH